jgi:gas vesicle protein
MNRKTLIAGILFAGLILATVLLLRSPEKGSRTSDATPRPIAKFGVDSFDTLEVTKGKDTTVIKKDGDSYKITKPIAYPADKDAAKVAFESMSKLDFDNIVSDQQSRHGEFEVGGDGLRVVVKKGDKDVADVRIGRTTNQFTMLRIEGKPEVWSVTGISKYQFDKDTNSWRDKTITTFQEKDIEKLQVASKDGAKIALAKPAPTDAGAPTDWHVVESSMKVEPFDKSVAGSMASQLSGLKANDFADGAKPEDTGLDSPELTVAVGLHDGKQQTLLVGKKKGEDDYYAKMADQPQVFLVKKYAIANINKRPVEFRDKTMCNLKSDEVTEVAVARDKESFTLAKQGSAWKLAKPAGTTLDESKVSAITGSFTDWKAQSIAEDNSPKATGLAKPKASVVVKSSVKGHTCQFKVGGETSDKSNYFVQVAGQPNVFVAPKWNVDRVLVKLDDLKKK